MLNNIQDWLNDLQIRAVENKQTAKANGQKYIWYSSVKNKDIKRKFSEEGERLSRHGIRLLSRSSGNSSGGEWLYDFVLREFDENNHLLGIRLVAEIELSDSKAQGLVYDFNKLLQADAPYKVFIFQQKDENLYSEILKKIEAAINSYRHRLDSHFLIACWITTKYRFIYQHHVVGSERMTNTGSETNFLTTLQN
ncbi:MAG: hypothetical protein ACXWAT_08170 [Methylobacter sp.]